jgi:hypothetical protein
MAPIENAPKASRYFMPAVLLFCLAIGAFLRLDQLTTQVLIEDEWHAVHQLLLHAPDRVSHLGMPITFLCPVLLAADELVGPERIDAAPAIVVGWARNRDRAAGRVARQAG